MKTNGKDADEPELLKELAEKKLSKKDLYKLIERNFNLLAPVITGLNSAKPSIRYGCGSVLSDLSVNYPEKLYPYWDSFAALLESEHRILVWNAFAILANLCQVDSDKKFDSLFEKYFGYIHDEYMVTVANVVGNSIKIALSKPYLVAPIVDIILQVENIRISPHLTDECKRVIAEKAVDTLDKLFDKMPPQEKTKTIAFIKRQANSSRATLMEAANEFLRKLKE